MKIGIVSDVHCQHEALADTVAAMEQAGVDEILLAGDAHYEYRFSNEVAELTQEHQMRYILGNHEMMLLSPRGERAATAPHVRQSNADFVRAAPERIRTHVAAEGGNKVLTMVHASPWEPFGEYLYEGNPLFQRADELDTDYLILGHTHVPMTMRVGRTLIINPGSLAFSRDPGGSGLITYAILDTSTDEVQLVREPKPKPV